MSNSKPHYCKDYTFREPELNGILRFGFLILLFWIILFISKAVLADVRVKFDARQRIPTLKNEIAYQFLTKSAYQYYQRRAYHQALHELHLAHRIFPTKYEANYIRSITLTALCKQRGIYCDEAIVSLEYLNDYWILDKEWLEHQRLTLGLI